MVVYQKGTGCLNVVNPEGKYLLDIKKDYRMDRMVVDRYITQKRYVN